MTTSSDSLLTLTGQALDRLAPADTPLVVAYSGGLDSSVLLDLLRRLRPGCVRALHVNHGLQPEAAEWAGHCVAAGAAIGIEVGVLNVTVASDKGVGPEASARAARYAALAAELRRDEWLVTGQHRQDQLETVLLALLRGAGVHGLAAMPARGSVHGCRVLRPLLDTEADDLRAYAVAQGLEWVDDPSNAVTDFDRNYLRHEVVPLLRARWPGAARAAARSARHCAAAMQRVDSAAAEQLAGIRVDNCIQVEGLRALTDKERKDVLRLYCREQELPVPAENQLSAALQALLSPRSDAEPLAAWPGARIRRYRGLLWSYPEATDPGSATTLPEVLDWNGRGAIELGGVRGQLSLQPAAGPGIAADAVDQGVQVRFRGGGEELRPARSAARRSFKKLLQESAVLPWMREHIPLLYIDGQLVAAGDSWLNHEHPAVSDRPGLRPVWTPECAWRSPFDADA